MVSLATKPRPARDGLALPSGQHYTTAAVPRLWAGELSSSSGRLLKIPIGQAFPARLCNLWRTVQLHFASPAGVMHWASQISGRNSCLSAKRGQGYGTLGRHSGLSKLEGAGRETLQYALEVRCALS